MLDPIKAVSAINMSRSLKTPTSASKDFENKLKEDVDVLFAIHHHLGGDKQGKRYEFLKTLSRSIVVFSIAALESYLENVSEWAFSHILKKKQLKVRFLNKAADKLTEQLLNKESTNRKNRIMGIIVRGADLELRNSILKNEIRYFHTPNVENINDLIHTCVGIRKISSSWVWQGTSSGRVVLRLDAFLKTRHKIAHGILTPKIIKEVNLNFANSCIKLVKQIVKCTDRKIIEHLR